MRDSQQPPDDETRFGKPDEKGVQLGPKEAAILAGRKSRNQVSAIDIFTIELRARRMSAITAEVPGDDLQPKA